MAQKGASLYDMTDIVVPHPLPSLVLANRIYQDAARSDELMQETRVRHPAFMPVRFRVRKPL